MAAMHRSHHDRCDPNGSTTEDRRSLYQLTSRHAPTIAAVVLDHWYTPKLN